MNKKRLLKLADLLEADAKNKTGIKFDLGLWGSSEDAGSPASVSCGTTACAMGLAVISGAFKRAGLTNSYGAGARVISPAFNGMFGFDAAAGLFEIDVDAAYWLFSEDAYRGKTEGAVGERNVAKRIRGFVAGTVSPKP